MNNKLDGMTASFIAVDEFKKLDNKQGENKMKKDITVKGPIFSGELYAHSFIPYHMNIGQPKNPYWPTKVIENNRTVVVYFENGSKRVVTCSEEDTFNKEFGFLLALAHEVFGSKDKYRQMYTKKVDKRAYPKMKNNQKETKIVSDLKLSETKFTEKQLEEMKEIVERTVKSKNNWAK